MTNKTKRTLIIGCLSIALIVVGGLLLLLILQDYQPVRPMVKKGKV